VPKTAMEEFLSEMYGGDYTVSEYTPSIGTAPAVILNHSFERMAYVIINTGGGDLYLSIGPNPNNTQGIILYPGGGSLAVNAQQDLAIPGVELYGWAPAGGTSCIIFAAERYVIS